MIESVLSIVATALGLVAERMRRKWKEEERKREALEIRIAEIESERNRGWDHNNPGSVFNAK